MQALRIALAAAAGFTLGELAGWDFPFLPSLIAVQLLSAGRTVNFRRAVGFVVLMAVGAASASSFRSYSRTDR